jgi:hypothetical protein
MGALWRSRRWRLLLNIIDHLPRNSYYQEAVSKNKEHVQNIAEAMGGKKDGEAYRPPMHTYSTEVELLQFLCNQIMLLRHESAQANSKPDLLLPPESGVTDARKHIEWKRRKAKHEALVARVLPQRKVQ